MNAKDFEHQAGVLWDQIPDGMKSGVEALVVETEALEHPNLDGVYTLGECMTEHWPSSFGDGDVRSELRLYHGSFRELAARDAGFEWGEELWETILHELLHHRESAAREEGLDVIDWAEEQHRRRLWGMEFDPGYLDAVPPDDEGLIRLDSELLILRDVKDTSPSAAFDWRGRGFTIRIPSEPAIVFARIRNLASGRLTVVVRRRRSWWAIWRPAGGLAEVTVRALPAAGG